MNRHTAQDLYEQHRQGVAETGRELPSWGSLPEWEKEEWERHAAAAKPPPQSNPGPPLPGQMK